MDVQTADPDALAEALFGTDERAMRAYALARRAHAGQRDKAGAPYILHPLSVAQGVMASGDEDALVCALLHDVVEDGGVDLDEIRQEFGDAEVLNRAVHTGQAVGLALFKGLVR